MPWRLYNCRWKDSGLGTVSLKDFLGKAVPGLFFWADIGIRKQKLVVKKGRRNGSDNCNWSIDFPVCGVYNKKEDPELEAWRGL